MLLVVRVLGPKPVGRIQLAIPVPNPTPKADPSPMSLAWLRELIHPLPILCPTLARTLTLFPNPDPSADPNVSYNMLPSPDFSTLTLISLP